MTNRKFYKTQVVVTVLSEEPINPNCNLEDLYYAITEGECSGVTEIMEPTELNGKEAANALLEQASDPEFFDIDENGDDLDHEETADELYDRKYREEMNQEPE